MAERREETTATKRVLVSAFLITPDGPHRVHLAFTRLDDVYLALTDLDDESVKHGSFARVDGEYAGCGTHRWELTVWGTPSELAKLGPDRRDKLNPKRPAWEADSAGEPCPGCGADPGTKHTAGCGSDCDGRIYSGDVNADIKALKGPEPDVEEF